MFPFTTVAVTSCQIPVQGVSKVLLVFPGHVEVQTLVFLDNLLHSCVLTTVLLGTSGCCSQKNDDALAGFNIMFLYNSECLQFVLGGQMS